MFGFLNLDKPAGITSRDAVNRVQRAIRPHKVGHAGTLDPLATGVLVLAIGPATRLIEYVQAQPKTYVGAFLLGHTSPTEDCEGDVQPLEAPPIPSRAEIEAALPQFTGRIQQVPPAFSALKVQGQRAYDLARKGKTVELAPRTVEIYRLRIVDYDYPTLRLEIQCSGGTYIRSLGRDLARQLGSDAVMSALQRTAIGPFTIEHAQGASSWSAESVEAALTPPLEGLANLPARQLTSDEITDLQRGMPLVWDELPTQPPPEHHRALDEQGRLIAVLRPTPRGWRTAKAFWDVLPESLGGGRR